MTWIEFGLIILGILALLALFNWVFKKQYPAVFSPGIIKAVNVVVIVLLVIWSVMVVTGVGKFWNAPIR